MEEIRTKPYDVQELINAGVNLTVDDIIKINKENAEIIQMLSRADTENKRLLFTERIHGSVKVLIAFAFVLIVIFALTGKVDLTVAVVAGFVSTLVQLIIPLINSMLGGNINSFAKSQVEINKSIKKD